MVDVGMLEPNLKASSCNVSDRMRVWQGYVYCGRTYPFPVGEISIFSKRVEGNWGVVHCDMGL